MTRVLSIVVALAACSPEHDIEVLLGPNEETLTIGFRCVRDAAPSELMFARAVSGGILRFSLLFDVITIDGVFPGCRGEELVQACSADNCRIYTGDGRYCVDIAVPVADLDFADPRAMIAKLTELVRAQNPIIADDPPDLPVLVRAVASSQTCAELMAAPSLDAVVGCAHSCPMRLDDIDGPVTLSLDALTNQCEQLVRACASFPFRP